MSARRMVAVMQPYFAAYAGYYRLLACADLFVIYDCVQFPRRGWVHRNRLPDHAGQAQWLTLPLARAPFDARIDSLSFAEDAQARMAEQLRRFPSLSPLGDRPRRLLEAAPMTGPLVDYLHAQLAAARDLLGLSCEFVRSSALGVDPALRAQDRILAIVEAVGGSDYVNPPGGRGLYDPDAFAARGLALHFLDDHLGPAWSLLHRLAEEPAQALAAEIASQASPLRAAAGAAC